MNCQLAELSLSFVITNTIYFLQKSWQKDFQKIRSTVDDSHHCSSVIVISITSKIANLFAIYWKNAHCPENGEDFVDAESLPHLYREALKHLYLLTKNQMALWFNIATITSGKFSYSNPSQGWEWCLSE